MQRVMGPVEKRILSILHKHSGEIYQSTLVCESGFSKSRISEILTRMEEIGSIYRVPLGKNLKVVSREPRKPKYNHERLKLGFTRSTEYAFLPLFAKLMRQENDIKIDFKIYGNGIEVARDLSEGRIDLGIAPILTLIESFSLGSNLRILAPSGAGGSSLIERIREKEQKGTSRHISTTRLSTMELLLRTSMNKGLIQKERDVIYSTSPQQMVANMLHGYTEVVSIWEPFATILLSKHTEFRRVTRYSELENHCCCTIAGGTHVSRRLLKKAKETFSSSIESYLAEPESTLDAFSTLVGFEKSLVAKVRTEYTYPEEIDRNVIARQFEDAGVLIPAASTICEAMAQIN